MDPVEQAALMERIKQTYAVVVAVERCPGLGEAWKLPGVGKQAAGFARWLVRDRGIAPTHVQVFASGADRAAFTSLGIPKGQVAPAEAGPLNPFLAGLGETWPDGRILLIYWVGHGFLGRDGSRRLILGDATPELKTNLDVNQLVLLLRSNLAGTFGKQIAFIDTCARFFETMQSKSGLPEGGLSQGDSWLDPIEQNFFFAASSGEYGTKDLFGPCILDLLQEKLPPDQWPPDRRWLWPRIDEEFERVLKQAGAKQQPAWLEYRQDLNSGSTRGVLPTLSDIQRMSERTGFPVHHLRRLTELAADCGKLASAEARDRLYDAMGADGALNRPAGTREDCNLDLMRLIAGAIERGTTDLLVRHVKAMESDGDKAYYFGRTAESVTRKKVGEFWPMLAGVQLPLTRARLLYKAARGLRADEDDPDSLEEIVYLLSDRDRDSDEPLVEFLLRAARESPQNPACERLSNWLESQPSWAGILAKLRDRLHREAHRTGNLLIAIGVSQNAWRVTRAWLWSAATGSPAELAPLEPQGDLGSDIASLLNEALSSCKSVLLEVLVPEELLHLERGLLALKDRGATLDPERRHPVVLRWQDRMAAPAREFRYQSGLWKKTGTLIRERLASQRRACWLERGCNPEDFYRQYDEGKAGELIGIRLSSEGGSREELIGLICHAGLPFACWPRCETVDLKAAASSLDALLRQHQFDELPGAVLAQRGDGKALDDILLLWDDPQRNPYDRKFADVSQRG